MHFLIKDDARSDKEEKKLVEADLEKDTDLQRRANRQLWLVNRHEWWLFAALLHICFFCPLSYTPVDFPLNPDLIRERKYAHGVRILFVCNDRK